jgi:hypothetical protein
MYNVTFISATKLRGLLLVRTYTFYFEVQFKWIHFCSYVSITLEKTPALEAIFTRQQRIKTSV